MRVFRDTGCHKLGVLEQKEHHEENEKPLSSMATYGAHECLADGRSGEKQMRVESSARIRQ